jgi:hypothetical protein
VIPALAGALAIGLSLGIFGSGGSILTVPVLIYLLGRPDKTAIAESLAIVGGIALVSAGPYAKDRLVDWRNVLLFGVPAMAGTSLGAFMAALVSGRVQLVVFALVMFAAATLMWKRSAPGAVAESTEEKPERRRFLRIAADGIGVGALTGFVGVGGGFLIVPALVLLGGLSMRLAVGTSLMIIAMKSAIGFASYLPQLDRLGLSVQWSTVGIFIAVGAIGSVAGKAISGRIDQRRLKRGFALFLLVMAAFIIFREGAAMA